ncbi:cytochrome P450 [Candidatus Poriferisocius sp.]|uniref:cytochrome P450 n=1 Tax=Candidatus Poriferisocius sp. TaxID=3101276 RepID=UPI003B0240FE
MEIFDPLAHTGDVPYAKLAGLRDECPVARTPSGWYLTRFDDVLTATKDVDTFVSSFRDPGVVVPEEEKLISEIAEPRHGKVRRIINATVAHHKSMRAEPFVRDLCHQYLDPILERGHGELVAEFITPVPINVISHLIGVPAEDWGRFHAWTDEVVLGSYSRTNRNERGEGLAGAHPEFCAYLDALIAERRAGDEAPDDLVTRLITTEIDGHRLTDVEIRTQLAFLIMSGNETTRHLIGNLLGRIIEDPDLFATLKADRGLCERAVEESLRIDSPVHMLIRDCTADTDAFGVPMRSGDKIVFGISSANRDEDYFEDPEVFRLDRDRPKDHVAFGGGPHICPGASLARLEGRVALEVFLDRVAAAEPVPGRPRRKTPVFWANGPDRLDALLTPEPRSGQ